LEKEKSDLQYQLDSEQKGIHARRDSDVYFLPSFKLFSQLKISILFSQKNPLNGLLLLLYISPVSFLILLTSIFPFLSFFNAGTNKNIKFYGQKGKDSPSTQEEEKHFNGIGSSSSKGFRHFPFHFFHSLARFSASCLLCE
jgi:hypothetical protein